MAILKSPPKPPKNETLQIRIEEGTKLKLQKYAEFIAASEAYVVSEALKLIFHKDHEFKTWLESGSNDGPGHKEISDSLFDVVNETANGKSNQPTGTAQEEIRSGNELADVISSRLPFANRERPHLLGPRE
jgi:hypothetical protein